MTYPNRLLALVISWIAIIGLIDCKPAPNHPSSFTKVSLSDTNFYALIDRVKTLDVPMSEPVAGEWLSVHNEPGQTFPQYLKSSPVRPDRERNKLYLLPLGEFSAENQQMLESTRQYMELFFGLETILEPALPLSILPDKARRGSQVQTGYILNRVLAPALPEDAVCYMAICSADLYPGEGWNFVFGQASLHERVGVSSVFRFGDPHAASPEEGRSTLLRRLIRTMSHETGHMLSMWHCINAKCAMNGSNNLTEADSQPLHLCSQCLAKLCWSVDYDAKARFAALQQFYEQHRILEEVAFCKAALKALAN